MSHFTTIEVDYSQKCEADLVASLEEIFGHKAIEVAEGNDLPLFGYHGDDRSKLATNNPNYAPKCALRIPKKHVGSASNDIGFFRTEDGKYRAYISDYDKGGHFDKSKQNKVAQSYTLRVAEKKLKAQGYQVKKVPQKNGSVQLTAIKYK